MSCYGPLAGFYDRLTSDVDYGRFADLYEAIFREDGGEFRLLLDLCCGTGSMSLELSQRGYEIIAVDASEDMLMQAREKCAGLAVPPLFLLLSNLIGVYRRRDLLSEKEINSLR